MNARFEVVEHARLTCIAVLFYACANSPPLAARRLHRITMYLRDDAKARSNQYCLCTAKFVRRTGRFFRTTVVRLLSQGSNARPEMLRAPNVKSSNIQTRAAAILGFVDLLSDIVGRILSALYLLSLRFLVLPNCIIPALAYVNLCYRNPFGSRQARRSDYLSCRASPIHDRPICLVELVRHHPLAWDPEVKTRLTMQMCC